MWLCIEQPSRTCIDDTLGHDGAELGHHVFVLVADDLGIQLAEVGHLQNTHTNILSEKYQTRQLYKFSLHLTPPNVTVDVIHIPSHPYSSLGQ